ncbi:MAG: hypothetical protein GC164_12210 [Phycisphaera sp.]|nr:hypothetical protein [Phycisphaera sp.]
MRTYSPHRLIACLCVVLFALPVLAEDEGDTAQQTAQRPWKLNVTGGVAHLFDTDIENSGGSFSLTQARVGVDGGVGLSEDLKLSLALDYVHEAFNFKGTTGFAGLGPWSDVDTINVSTKLSWNMDDQWTFFGGPIFTWSAESGADFADAFTFGGSVGAIYTFDDRLSIGGGIAILDRLEDSVNFFPIVIVNWRIADDLTLRVRSIDLGAGTGFGVELAWAFAKDFELSGGVMYQSRRFRLDSAGTAPNGVGEFKAAPVYVKLTWSPCEYCSVSAIAGITTFGRLGLESSTGGTIAKQDFDATPIIGASAVVRF